MIWLLLLIPAVVVAATLAAAYDDGTSSNPRWCEPPTVGGMED